MPLDTDTIDCLDDVKKGKPRRFVMICKGVQIKSLVAYKKGSLERYKKQAKEEGKGQFYHGVIGGKGVDITFYLCRADGYEKPPGKELILKDFLKTEADLKCKPVYEIVDVLPDVADEYEAPESETESDQDERPPEAPPVLSTSGEGQLIDSETFMSRLKEMLPDLKRAQAANSPYTDQLKELTAQAQTLAKEKKYGEGMEVLTELAGVIEKALSESPPQAPPQQHVDANTFGSRLKALLPSLKQALGSDSQYSAQLKSLAADAQAMSKDKKYAEGMQVLDRLEPLIKSALASRGGGKKADPLAIWQTAKDAVDEQLNSFVAELRKSGDEYLTKIAEGGIHGFIEGPSRVYVKLQVVLMELKSASGDARQAAQAKVAEATKSYRTFLEASKFLEICDTNDLNGPLTIRQTLLDALSEIDATVAA
jgi:hypothetical protein